MTNNAYVTQLQKFNYLKKSEIKNKFLQNNTAKLQNKL